MNDFLKQLAELLGVTPKEALALLGAHLEEVASLLASQEAEPGAAGAGMSNAARHSALLARVAPQRALNRLVRQLALAKLPPERIEQVVRRFQIEKLGAKPNAHEAGPPGSKRLGRVRFSRNGVSVNGGPTEPATFTPDR